MARIGSYANVLKYKFAVAQARKVDDPLKLAHRLRHLGDAYYYAKRSAQADACYVEALSIYRDNELRQPLDLANAIRSFAVLKGESGAAEEARSLWQEAHDLYVAVSDAPDVTESWRRGVLGGVAETAARLALLAQRQGDLPRSREWLSEASAAAELSNDPEASQYLSEVRAQMEG